MKGVLASVGLLLITAGPASADLVFFQTGRSISVKSHRVEGSTIILELRNGGEMQCDLSLVAEVKPDEVPYPEPEPAAIAEEAVASAKGPSAALRDSAQYGPLIQKISEEQGVDSTLVRAVIQVESGYQPRARSSKGALGLMQLMPATARHYGVRNLFDPKANIEAGIKHLKSLLDRFPLALALAAYNAGEAAVEKFRGVPPYPETQAYVSRILALVGS